jgi:copper homeostasis protein
MPMNHKLSTVILEVCANSATSAIAAQDGGAARVELCENLAEGGTTPSYGQMILARKHLHIKLYVLIRPRRGDFLYTDLEFEVMQADIRTCIEAGCDGVVIGMLKADGSVDKERCTELVRLARQWGLGVTFHRAFDMCADQFQALEDIIEIGCERILTSGGKSTAMEGATCYCPPDRKSRGPHCHYARQRHHRKQCGRPGTLYRRNRSAFICPRKNCRRHAIPKRPYTA